MKYKINIGLRSNNYSNQISLFFIDWHLVVDVHYLGTPKFYYCGNTNQLTLSLKDVFIIKMFSHIRI